MLKTCMNCKYFNFTMSGDNNYHLHNWCSAWKQTVPDDRINGLEKHYAIGFDDIETGYSFCFAFKEREKEELTIEEALKRRNQNQIDNDYF